MWHACRIPWLTLLLAAAMVALFWLTRYDDAILRITWYSRTDIMHGEPWRLLTGHLVHFSLAHLAADLCAFAVLALLLELQQGSKALAMMLLWLALPASMAMLLLVPGLQYYGGISSVNYGLMTWLCLTHPLMRQYFTLAGWTIAPGKLLACAVLAHIGFQYKTASSLLSAAPTDEVIVIAWQTHLACTLTALLLVIIRNSFAGMSLPVAHR